MVCPSVREDNQLAKALGLSPLTEYKSWYNYFISPTPCRPCTLRGIRGGSRSSGKGVHMYVCGGGGSLC